MSYSYCVECNHSNGLDYPTDEEVLTNGWHCPYCAAVNPINEDVYRATLLNMLERIERLESF